ncbi:MAG: DUF4129 domain-containing protein [Ornithinimicrobium sp.]
MIVLVVAAVLLWGASSGEPLISGPRVDLPDGPALPDDAASTVGSQTPAQAGSSDTESDGTGINAALIAQVAVAALIAWLVLRWFRNREPDEPAAFEQHQPGDELDQLVEATASSRDSHNADRHGDPRNAVVACWVALEDALEAIGEAPQAGETSLDVTQRVLGGWQVDPEPLRLLADLFREARFSRHAITEQHADEAISALEQIHAGLARAAQRRDRTHGDSAADGTDSDESFAHREDRERGDNTSAGMP